MFNFTKRQKQTDDLQEVINSVMKEMSDCDPYSKEFTIMAKNLDTLYSAKSKERDKVEKKRITPDTLVLVAANLIGLILIINHEQTGIITSKALNFVVNLKGRV